MSSMWRKTLIYLGLVDEPDEHDPSPEHADSVEGDHGRVASARSNGGQRPGARGAERADTVRAPRGARTDQPDSRSVRGADNVRELRVSEPGAAHVRPMTQTGVARVAVVEVARFDDVEDVGARYRSGQPVLFDVAGADAADARRVLDFVSGVTYALRGRLSRAGDRAFLLAPEGVSVPADERRRLASMGYELTSGDQR